MVRKQAIVQQQCTKVRFYRKGSVARWDANHSPWRLCQYLETGTGRWKVTGCRPLRRQPEGLLGRCNVPHLPISTARQISLHEIESLNSLSIVLNVLIHHLLCVCRCIRVSCINVQGLDDNWAMAYVHLDGRWCVSSNCQVNLACNVDLTLALGCPDALSWIGSRAWHVGPQDPPLFSDIDIK